MRKPNNLNSKKPLPAIWVEAISPVTDNSPAGAEQASFIAFHMTIDEIVARLRGKVKR
jgi:hypothetical protein